MNRFEWLKGALQCRDLTDRAKALASAMAVQFANDETGQINPSIATLSGYLGASKDTIKRAVADLVKAGWLSRTEGRGAGNRTVYTLLSPGKVVAFTGQKKGAAVHFQDEKKGAALRAKGCSRAPSYNKDKQSLEQRARTAPANPPSHVRVIVHHGSFAETAWNEWLANQGEPPLATIGIPISDAQGRGWGMPERLPPVKGDTIGLSIAEKHLWHMLNRSHERRHA